MERTNRKVRVGTVVSNAMDKTCVVMIDRYVNHPLYKKKVKLSKKYQVHDENNECEVGDRIKIMETRLLSKNKYFRLVEIVEKVK